MLRTIFTIAICAFTILANAQYHEWSFNFGDNQFEHGNGIALDPLGNVYVCGSFEDMPDMDPDTSTAIITETGNNGDIYIAKYNSAGEYQWAFPIGIGGHDEATDIEVDAQGNVFVTGYYEWDVDFDPGPGSSILTNPAWRSLFLAKYDTDGDHQWSFGFANGGNVDRLPGLALDQTGNVYVTGDHNGATDFDPGPGTVQLPTNSGSDIFVAKYDTDGNYVWVESFGGPGFDRGEDLAIDSDENVYVCGMFSDSMMVGSTMLFANGGLDAFFAKLDPDGNPIMAYGFGSGGTDESVTELALDPYNNLYMIGYASGGDIDPGIGVANVGMGAETDPFFAKFNENGDLLWVRNISDQDEGKGRGIAVDHSGNVYVTGFLDGSFDFDFGPGTNVLVGWDIFIAKYDTDGNHIWAFDAGDSAYDSGFDIAVDDSMNVYTTGVFYGTIDMDPDTVTAELVAGPGGRDVFVAKHGPCYRALSTVILCDGPYIFPDGTSSDSSTIHGSTWITSAGCDSVIITDLTIVEIDTTLSSNGNTLISNEPDASYQWLDCDNGNTPIIGATGSMFTPMSSGNYAVEVTVNECTGNSPCSFVGSVGILEEGPVEFSAYPNPFDHTIQLQGDLSDVRLVRVLDLSGRVLLETYAAPHIDLAKLGSGSYLLSIIFHNGNEKILRITKLRS